MPAKTVVNRVVVNVQQYSFQITAGGDFLAAEILFKRATGAVVFFIEGLGVGVEKV